MDLPSSAMEEGRRRVGRRRRHGDIFTAGAHRLARASAAGGADLAEDADLVHVTEQLFVLSVTEQLPVLKATVESMTPS